MLSDMNARKFPGLTNKAPAAVPITTAFHNTMPEQDADKVTEFIRAIHEQVVADTACRMPGSIPTRQTRASNTPPLCHIHAQNQR